MNMHAHTVFKRIFTPSSFVSDECLSQQNFWNSIHNITFTKIMPKTIPYLPGSAISTKSNTVLAHVAKIYGRLRLIRSVLRAWKIFRIKIDWNCNFVGLLHHPFWLQLVMTLSGNHFQLLNPHGLAKDHWWGFITQNTHMIQIVNSDFKWCIHFSRSLYYYFNFRRRHKFANTWRFKRTFTMYSWDFHDVNSLCIHELSMT